MWRSEIYRGLILEQSTHPPNQREKVKIKSIS
jgi:hypothetical protein